MTASPQIAIGPNCTAFALSGFLPLQPSPQSSLIVSRLVYVHSVVPASEDTLPSIDRTFIEIGGTFTSGNVTIVLNSLSLRTITADDACPLASDDLKDDKTGLDERELIAGTCVSASINWGASAGITGVQNASTIARTAGNILSGIAGYLVHAISL
jgi:hypothetical protein